MENFLDERMLSRIKSDLMVTDAELIQGPNGLLAKLESYYTDDLPMIIRRHNFISCKQERGKKFMPWWERKLQKGCCKSASLRIVDNHICRTNNHLSEASTAY